MAFLTVLVPAIAALLVPGASAYPNYCEVERSLPENSTAKSIEWGTCPESFPAPPNVQCANFSVPIDWDNPSGERFNLGMVKLLAGTANYSVSSSNSSKRDNGYIGSLFFNPGGPGQPASEIVLGIATVISTVQPLTQAFDIIGLDPRGVGLSQQINCSAEIMAERVSLFPQNQSEYDALVDKNKRFGESCRNLSGSLIDYIDTISAAKDHEAVRIALGDEPLNYFGMSYGTQLGAQYAQLFPDNIRVMALDGILQHSQSEAANIFIESSAYDLGLNSFFEWAATNDTSALKGQNVSALWTALVANATNKPIPAAGCNGTTCQKDVNGEDILFNTQQYLTFAFNNPLFGSDYGTLAQAIQNATTQGDATALSNTFGPIDFSHLAISCLDQQPDVSLTLDGVKSKELMSATYTNLTRGASETWQLQQSCIGWPAATRNPYAKLDVQTNATILMTQSTRDPSCGMPWALGMLQEIQNKVLVVREGDGHTSLLLGGATSQVIQQYLISGNAPASGMVLSS